MNIANLAPGEPDKKVLHDTSRGRTTDEYEKTHANNCNRRVRKNDTKTPTTMKTTNLAPGEPDTRARKMPAAAARHRKTKELHKQYQQNAAQKVTKTQTTMKIAYLAPGEPARRFCTMPARAA